MYSVEIEPALVDMARQNLQKADVANVSVDLGDAAQGWPLYAPYDVIVLSGSTPVLPESIVVSSRSVAVCAGTIGGEAPAMRVRLVTRSDENAFSTVTVFEYCVAPLINATQHLKNSFSKAYQ